VKCTVLALHGMGDPRGDFSASLMRRVRGAVPGVEVDWRPVLWGAHLTSAETRLEAYLDSWPMRWIRSRRWALHALADALRVADVGGRDLDLAHDEVVSALPDDGPTIVVAHSLGGWVARSCDGLDGAHLITLGTTVPLFAEALPAARLGSWLNLYYPSDVLGWPALLTEARSVALSPRWWRMWLHTPIAHACYWSDREVARHVVTAIREVVR